MQINAHKLKSIVQNTHSCRQSTQGMEQ